jgi:tetratricopeptide (TPR) repeat protein
MWHATDLSTMGDLAAALRELRRRHARRSARPPLTYRELAVSTGWSYSVIGDYFAGNVLAPTDRFDVLVRLLGAAETEQRVLATARDRVEENGRRRSSAGAAGRSPAPRQLPPDVSGFAGRAAQLTDLDALVRSASRGPGTSMVAAIAGTAGVGKTALAVHWAHLVASEFPDGQLYANLRGFDIDATADPLDVVRGFLAALNVPAPRLPATLEAATALYRTLLADRRVLVVLDNARDTEQVRPLLPAASGCLAVVTSRNVLSGLVAELGARVVTVDLFTPAEAVHMLVGRLGRARVDDEPRAVEEIITRCARLPLALAVVAARAAARPEFPLGTIAVELRDTHDRWVALAVDDPAVDVRAVFSSSYRGLTPPASRLFRLLVLHPGPEVTVAAAASLAAESPSRVRRLLVELAQASLISEPTPGRFVMHDLLRDYAAHQANLTDSADESRAAAHRVLDHYVHSAHTAALRLDPHRRPIAIPPAVDGTVPEQPTDRSRAQQWFTAEFAVLKAVVDHTVAAGLDERTWQLAWALTNFLDRQGHWHTLAAIEGAAAAAARRMGDVPGEARAHRNLARAHSECGRHDEALAELGHALELYRDVGDSTGQALTHLYLANASDRLDRHADALDHSRRALELNRACGYRRGEADALNAVGFCHAKLGQHRTALDLCHDALALFDELDDRDGQADSWDSLGYAHRHLGDHVEAVRCYDRAAALYRDLGDRHNEATTLANLGDAHHAAGSGEAAGTAWQRALTILEDLDHSDADALRTKVTSARPSRER